MPVIPSVCGDKFGARGAWSFKWFCVHFVYSFDKVYIDFLHPPTCRNSSVGTLVLVKFWSQLEIFLKLHLRYEIDWIQKIVSIRKIFHRLKLSRSRSHTLCFTTSPKTIRKTQPESLWLRWFSESSKKKVLSSHKIHKKKTLRNWQARREKKKISLFYVRNLSTLNIILSILLALAGPAQRLRLLSV